MDPHALQEPSEEIHALANGVGAGGSDFAALKSSLHNSMASKGFPRMNGTPWDPWNGGGEKLLIPRQTAKS